MPSSTEEGAAVPPQNRGSWSSFLRVRTTFEVLTFSTGDGRWVDGSHEDDLVDYQFLRRPLVPYGAAIHSLIDVSDRVLVILGRTSLALGCARTGDGPCQEGASGAQVVLEHLETAIL